MRTICIAGKNDIAVDVLLYCINKFYDYKIVCITNKNDPAINTWQRSLKWYAQRKQIPIVSLEDVYEIEDLLFLSLEFDRIIKPDRFKSTNLYNIHFSMLPQYKGMYTSVLPILDGKNFTGVTLHRIDAGIDTGDIVVQKKVEILHDDTALDLYRKLISEGTKIVIEQVENLLRREVTAYPQDWKESTYYSKKEIDYNDITIKLNETAYQIGKQIRAFCFRPYQIMKWNGCGYIACKILNERSTLKPGTIIEDTDIYTEVATVDYNVRLYKDVLSRLFEFIKLQKNDEAKRCCYSEKIINDKDEHGWTALTVAVYNNNFEMTEYLVNHGGDTQVVNNNGTTLLMYAKNCFTRTGDATIFEYLLQIGLDPEEKDYYEKTVNDYCREEGVVSIGDYIVK